MTNKISRRQALVLLLVGVSSLSGCSSNTPTRASIRVDLLNVSERNGTYTFELRHRVELQGDVEPFRNVSVVIYDENGTEICRHPVGNFTEGGVYGPVNVTCHDFPHTISYDTEQNPCRPVINVNKRVYNSDTGMWVPKDIECD